MKQQYFKYVMLVGLIWAFAFGAKAQDVTVNARLDQQTLKIGDQTQLHLIVRQPLKGKVVFPKIADTLISKVQVLKAGKQDTTVDHNDPKMISVSRSYTITSFDAGTYTLPALAFKADTSTIKSNELILEVQTVKVDTTKAIYDIKQPLAVSYTFFDWLRDHWLAVALGMAIVLLILGIIWYIKSRPKKEVVIPEYKPDIPLHIQILEKLQVLRARKLYIHDAKAYHTELTDIIRDYLEHRYVIKTHEKTSDEIFESLKYIDIDQENRNLLRQILLLADMVKFAKEQPLPPENEQSMDNAIAFVNKTKQAITAPKPTEGGSNAGTTV
ncbi:hypothetical protein HQ865_02555 [Mucilaginibacter mali]|uniref:Oxygen tolerance protein BatD n=1 Tax=Mucilaginibacter mali TaxID=2740462 RepID=A0A7D4Q881_9SPHI|nr:BatD family protein [Mucilaginibacter mali]QKJ28684.1 hypothetical protein HQ865_02555 [Mucilaginibacter mali]